MNTLEKIDWLIENEGCELADGYSGLLSFTSYCCPDKVCGKLIDLITPVVDEQYDIVKEEYDYEREQEEVAENRAETCASMIVSDMIGRGLITDGDDHLEWTDRIKKAVEIYA